MKLRLKDIDFVANYIVKFPNWKDLFEDVVGAYAVLFHCDSRLEVAFLIGALKEFSKGYHGYSPVEVSVPHRSFMLSDVHENSAIGEQVELVVQMKSAVKDITHDFGVFVGGSLFCAVEVDGYHVHKGRRDKDAKRDEGLGYRVHRLSELSDDPCSWFFELMNGAIAFMSIQENVYARHVEGRCFPWRDGMSWLTLGSEFIGLGGREGVEDLFPQLDELSVSMGLHAADLLQSAREWAMEGKGSIWDKLTCNYPEPKDVCEVTSLGLGMSE